MEMVSEKRTAGELSCMAREWHLYFITTIFFEPCSQKGLSCLSKSTRAVLLDFTTQQDYHQLDPAPFDRTPIIEGTHISGPILTFSRKPELDRIQDQRQKGKQLPGNQTTSNGLVVGRPSSFPYCLVRYFHINIKSSVHAWATYLPACLFSTPFLVHKIRLGSKHQKRKQPFNNNLALHLSQTQHTTKVENHVQV